MPTEVRFSTSDAEQARKISALLEALGYVPIQEDARPVESDAERVQRAVARLQRVAVHGLTDRERDIVAEALRGCTSEEIAEAQAISRATVKWHMHNIFAKTNTRNREGLLRRAFGLDDMRPRLTVVEGGE